MDGDCPRDRFHGSVRAFHDVMPSGAVDVHINKSWRSSLLGCADFIRSCRYGHTAPRPNRFNYPITEQNPGIGNFSRWSKCPADMKKGGSHTQKFIAKKFPVSAKENGQEWILPIIKNRFTLLGHRETGQLQ